MEASCKESTGIAWGVFLPPSCFSSSQYFFKPKNKFHRKWVKSWGGLGVVLFFPFLSLNHGWNVWERALLAPSKNWNYRLSPTPSQKRHQMRQKCPFPLRIKWFSEQRLRGIWAHEKSSICVTFCLSRGKELLPFSSSHKLGKLFS